MRALLRRRSVLWPAFLLVHLALAWSCLEPGTTGNSFNDVTGFYRFWVETALHHQAPWPAIGEPWVYTIVALVPMLIAELAGHDAYGPLWLVLVTALDAAAFAVLTSRATAQRATAAWYWLAALLALGPVALGRLDIVSVALAVIGIAVIEARPWLAGAVLALGAWVKFWPAALVVAGVVALKRRWQLLLGAAGVTIVVLLAAWGLHSRYAFSFVGQQSGRGLQIESPFATPLLWGVAAHVPGLRVYYDTGIYTFQVSGPGASALATAADVAMPAAIVVAVLVALRAVWTGAEQRLTVALLGLALTVGFCAFDKVGSPQYHAWFPVPVMLGLMVAARRFRLPAVLVLLSTVLTQWIYPWHYDELTSAQPAMLVVITVRNAIELALFGWAVAELWRAGGKRRNS